MECSSLHQVQSSQINCMYLRTHRHHPFSAEQSHWSLPNLSHHSSMMVQSDVSFGVVISHFAYLHFSVPPALFSYLTEPPTGSVVLVCALSKWLLPGPPPFCGFFLASMGHNETPRLDQSDLFLEVASQMRDAFAPSTGRSDLNRAVLPQASAAQ